MAFLEVEIFHSTRANGTAVLFDPLKRYRIKVMRLISSFNYLNINSYLQNSKALQNSGVFLWPSPHDLMKAGYRHKLHRRFWHMFDSDSDSDSSSDSEGDIQPFTHPELIDTKESGLEHLKRSGPNAQVLKRDLTRERKHLLLPHGSRVANGPPVDVRSLQRFEELWTQTERDYRVGDRPRFFAVPFNPDVLDKGDCRCYIVNNQVRYIIHLSPDGLPEKDTDYAFKYVRGLVPLDLLMYVSLHSIYPL
jgi:hypothetical protein